MTVQPGSSLGPHRRRRRLLWVSGAGGLVVLLGVLSMIAARSEGPATAASGRAKEAPAFELPDLADPERQVELADFRGTPLVLNFWASWCVPCRREMPVLDEVATTFEGRVAFLGIDHQDNREDALELVRRTGVAYPSAYDPKGDVAQAYGIFGFPSTVLVRPDGTIAATRTGELSRTELEDLIEKHFGMSAK